MKAIDVRCPRFACNAYPGEPCRSLVSPVFHNSPGQAPPIKTPHRERREAAKKTGAGRLTNPDT